MEFDWDESNEEYIARHGISRVEAETVIVDPLAVLIGHSIEDGEVRYRQIGSTARGRMLVVAFTLRGEAVRPVTAFDADRATIRGYTQGRFQ